MTIANVHHSEAYGMARKTVCIFLCCVLVMTLFLLGSATIAFCTEGGAAGAADAIEQAVNQMANQIYQTMRSIITPVTICGFAYAGFQFLLGGAHGTETARKILVGSGIGLALVVFAPLFGQAIATWFAGSGSGDLTTYNPL